MARSHGPMPAHARPLASVLLMLAVVLLSLTAGCMAPADPPGDPDTYRLGGTFTEDADQGDVADLRGEAEARGGQVTIMESYPLQFDVTGLDRDACTELKAVLEQKPYTESVGGCLLSE